MKKNVMSGILCAVLAGSLMAGTITTMAEESDKKLKLAGIWIQEDQAGVWYQKGMQAACDENDAELVFSISGDQAKEQELLTTYALSGVDGICVGPVSQEASPLVFKSVSEEYNIPISNFVDENPTDWSVGGAIISHTGLGQSTAPKAIEYIKNNLDGKCKLGVITFKSQFPEPAAQRMNGFVDLLMADEDIDVEVVAEGEAWMQDQAIQVAGDMLTANPDINMLMGCNEGGVLGAVLAVKNAGLAGKVAVFGVDCGEQQLAMLKDEDNILQAVSAQDYYKVAYVSMNKLIEFIQTGDEALREVDVVDPMLVSRDDPDSIEAYAELISQQ